MNALRACGTALDSLKDFEEGSRPSGLLRELLPAGVVAIEHHGHADPASLWPEEEACIAHAGAKRRQEFAAGRQCARQALSSFGMPPRPLLVRSNRCPDWPLNFTGSITHTAGFAAAAVAPCSRIAGLGIDAERIGGVSDDLWTEVFVPEERASLRRLPAAQRGLVATLLFSARESFYKCQFGISGQWLEFQDVAVDLAGWQLGGGAFNVRPLRPLALRKRYCGALTGRFHVDADLVVTAMAMEVPATG